MSQVLIFFLLTIKKPKEFNRYKKDSFFKVFITIPAKFGNSKVDLNSFLSLDLHTAQKILLLIHDEKVKYTTQLKYQINFVIKKERVENESFLNHSSLSIKLHTISRNLMRCG